MPKKYVLLIPFIIFLCFHPPVLAARSLSISADKNVLNGGEELTVLTSQSGFTDGETITVKGAFYQDGSTNYFGLTKNEDNWIKNGDSTANQRQIIVNQWDGKLTVKSDFSDSGFKGEGEYKFKVGFYYTTTGGNPSSVNWSDSTTVQINEPDPTPIPTSSPSSTPLPSSSSSSNSSIKSPSPSPVPKKSPLVLGEKETSSPSASPKIEASISPSPSPANSQESPTKTKVAGILVGSGVILIGLSIGFYLWYKRLLGKDSENQNKDQP